MSKGEKETRPLTTKNENAISKKHTEKDFTLDNRYKCEKGTRPWAGGKTEETQVLSLESTSATY